MTWVGFLSHSESFFQAKSRKAISAANPSFWPEPQAQATSAGQTHWSTSGAFVTERVVLEGLETGSVTPFVDDAVRAGHWGVVLVAVEIIAGIKR